MDPRIREHAAIIVDHSVDLQAGDTVLISAPPVAEDLVVALYEAVGDRGGKPVTLLNSDRAQRGYLKASDEFELPEHMLALVENTDVHIAIRADDNVTETSDVSPETNAAYAKTMRPIREERLSKRWCLTQYPAPANAQLAELPTEKYEEFVWDAVLKDWEEQRKHQQQLVEILEDGAEVHIKSGTETDLRLSIAGNPVQNDYGEHNLPGGEVFTAPVRESVTGEVLFDKPLYHQGREVEDVYLAFEDGQVVDHAAGKNEAVLTEVLETDAGARYLGELGIGMNRSIDQFTYNMLFDEKMGDTVHMALGRAYEDTVGPDNEQNESAVHVDMIVDMSEDSVIEVDGEVIQRDGTFVFEEGF